MKYLVGEKTENGHLFFWRYFNKPGTPNILEAIDYGTYENALRTAREFNKSVFEIRENITYEIVRETR